MTLRKINRELRETLKDLEQYRTFPLFSRGFYELLRDLLDICGPGADPLRRCLLVLLQIERRRHRALSRAAVETTADLLRLARKSKHLHSRMRRLLRLLLHIPCRERDSLIAWHLLRAECYYHLGENGLVVQALRQALHLGCDHPLIHFALGYNVYARAMGAYTRLDPDTGRTTVTDAPRFAGACRRAISSFRRGLEQTPFDAQLQWWIGFLSELVDERQNARLAYEEAARIDPEAFAEPTRERLQRLDGVVGDAGDYEEEERLAHLPPILEEDLEHARRLLAELDAFPPFFDLGDKP